MSQNCRIRKEFVTGLTDEEKAHYIDTVKTAASDERYKTKYNELLTIHKIYFDEGIHYPVNGIYPNIFLPWHRWFVLEYENLLREIDPDITLPYWDWSLVGASPFESSFWATDASGFGGNGNPPGGCVDTGPFREGEFSLIPSAGGGCLKREFYGRFATAADVIVLLNEKNLIHFQSVWESYHNDVHNNIGGTMPTTNAAAAPEFFEHHGFVDKVFSDWQKKGYDETYFKTITTKMPATDYYPRDLLDLENQPGNVCVKYEDPQSEAFLRLKSR